MYNNNQVRGVERSKKDVTSVDLSPGFAFIRHPSPFEDIMRNYINIADYLEDRVAIYMFVSLRGTGKTYSTTHLIYDDVMENGNEFIYLRRTKEELKATKDKVFSSIDDGKIYWLYHACFKFGTGKSAHGTCMSHSRYESLPASITLF